MKMSRYTEIKNNLENNKKISIVQINEINRLKNKHYWDGTNILFFQNVIIAPTMDFEFDDFLASKMQSFFELTIRDLKPDKITRFEQEKYFNKKKEEIILLTMGRASFEDIIICNSFEDRFFKIPGERLLRHENTEGSKLYRDITSISLFPTKNIAKQYSNTNYFGCISLKKTKHNFIN